MPGLSVVNKQFENVRGLLEQHSWEDAFDALTRVMSDRPDVLVEVSPGHFMTAKDYGRWLLTTLPDQGLASLRQRQDAWATQRYQASAEPGGHSQLIQILNNAFSSSAGDDALWRLGEWYWERGEIPQARRCWMCLLPQSAPEGDSSLDRQLRYPDTRIPAVQVWARLTLCDLAEQNVEAAEGHSERVRALDADAEGFLAGRQGPLADITSDLIRTAGRDNWSPDQPQWATFARQPSRNASWTSQWQLTGPLWSLRVPPVDTRAWWRPRRGMSVPAPSASFPVVWRGVILLHDGQQVQALKASDGHPAWPAHTGDRGASVYPPFPISLPPLHWPSAGVPRFTTTAHAGLSVARLGPALLSVGQSQVRLSRRPWVVGLNVDDEQGGLVWQVDDHALRESGWMFAGTPVADDGRFFASIVRNEPNRQFGIVCLDIADGAVLWQSTVCNILEEATAGLSIHGSNLLTTGEGLVFVSTDSGAIAAVDAITGLVHWVVTYPSHSLTPEQLSDETVNGLLPPLYDAGRLFTKPNDTSTLMALDAHSGTLLWRQRLPSRVVHLLGVTGKALFVSGDHLWSIDVANGQILWRFGSDDPEAFGFGRGAITGDCVFWPTRDELWIVDRTSGLATQRVPLRQGYDLSGGNLVLTPNRLLIAGPDHLSAFGLDPRENAGRHEK